MKTTDIIANSINRFAKGYIFTASSFKGEVKSLDAAAGMVFEADIGATTSLGAGDACGW